MKSIAVQLALVKPLIWAFHPVAGLNVSSIPIASRLKLVSIKSVKILALEFVDKMPNAELSTTIPSAVVLVTKLAILLSSAAQYQVIESFLF